MKDNEKAMKRKGGALPRKRLKLDESKGSKGSTSRKRVELVEPEEPAAFRNVIENIRQIKAGSLDPGDLSKTERRRCVQHLSAEGLAVPEISQVLGVSDRTLARDRKAIHEEQALEHDPRLGSRMAGRLVVEAETVMQRLRRLSRDRETPAAVKVDVEKTCFGVMMGLTERLQSLGYLPTAAQRIEADVHHESSSIPTHKQIKFELNRLEVIAEEAGDGRAIKSLRSSVAPRPVPRLSKTWVIWRLACSRGDTMTLGKLDCRPAVLSELRVKRRALGAVSPQAFANVYLGHHFHTPPSRMHDDLFCMLEEASLERGRRLAIAAPRGHAKTTVISLAYVLWSALYAKERFILIVSATREQATQLLADIRRELTSNEMLIDDFPDICQPLIKGRGGVVVKGHHLVIPNDVCIRVLGSSQGFRGMKHREQRPTLIIGDDLEELEQAISEDQRFKLMDWFSKTLLKAGTRKTNVLIIGTILHYDSLLARLTDPRKLRDRGVGWENRKYQAVESFSGRQDLWERWEAIRFGEEEHEGKSGEAASEAYFEANKEVMLEQTRVLWPEREDYYHLMCVRADEGRASFQSEKQNEPLDPNECLFKEELFRFWDSPGPSPATGSVDGPSGDTYIDVDELIRGLGKDAEFYGACDPSLGKRVGRGDYSGIITLVKHAQTGVMYVIGAEVARLRPDQVIERIVQLAKMYRFRHFVVESNQFQEVLANQLEDRIRKEGLSLRVEHLTTTTNKQGRIEALEPLIAQGKIRFSRRHQLLLEQLRQFPLGAHDDGPDALEMAVTWATKRGNRCWTAKLIGA